MQDFQTPEWVCELMVSLIDGNPGLILEPTPGEGNLITAIRRKYPNIKIVASFDFEKQTILKMQRSF